MIPKVLVISSYSGKQLSKNPEAEMVIRLKKSGVNIDVMTESDNRYVKKFREVGIKVHDYRPQKRISFGDVRYIRDVIRQRGYNIVHVFNNRAVRNAVQATKGLKVKLVTYRGFAGHVHWYKPTSYLGHLNPGVDKITCVSNGVKEQVQRQLFSKKQKAVTIYKGHDPEWYEAVQPRSKEDLGFSSDQFVVGIVANSRPMKGIPFLLKAMKYLEEYPDIHLALVGKNMDTTKHQQIVRHLPFPQNVHMLGFEKDVISLYPAFDVSVLSSVKGEGLSKVIIESMMMERPVVATNISGNDELVLHNQTGLLVPPKSPKDIAHAITELKNNPEKADRLANNGKEHIRNNFHIDRTVKEMKALYKELAK
jgi:glycosyltransferase involved in cell wall biosynthesis